MPDAVSRKVRRETDMVGTITRAYDVALTGQREAPSTILPCHARKPTFLAADAQHYRPGQSGAHARQTVATRGRLRDPPRAVWSPGKCAHRGGEIGRAHV